MTEHYNESVARHYAAYRPDLHGPILAKLIDDDETFSTGIDIGCGTGYSAIVLAKYCDRVVGIDPSHAMLSDAQQHPKLSYICASGDDLSCLSVGSADIASFAGSLHYAKNRQLREELGKVLGTGASVVVYDFEVRLDSVLELLKADIPSVASDYDHDANLLDWSEYEVVKRERGQLQLEISAEQLSHVILSDSNRFESLARMFNAQEPFQSAVSALSVAAPRHHLSVDIYCSRYLFSPERKEV